MLCILPESAASDITLHIHFTLIEAFCWENDIRVIKVGTFPSVNHHNCCTQCLDIICKNIW